MPASYKSARLPRSFSGQPLRRKGLPFTAFAAFILLFAVLMPARALPSSLPSPFEIRDLEGRTAPDFSLQDTEGRETVFSSHRGTVVLLSFWSSPCPTCTAEIPSLKGIQSRFKGRGFSVVSIATGMRADDVLRAIAKTPVHYPVLVDSSKRVALSLFKVFMVPAGILIDAQGTVVRVYLGEQNWMSPERLREIERLLR